MHDRMQPWAASLARKVSHGSFDAGHVTRERGELFRAPKSPAPPKLAPRVAVLVFGLRDAYHEAREAHARYVDALTKYGERRAEAFMAPAKAAGFSV